MMILIFLGMGVAVLAVCLFSNTDRLLMMPMTNPQEFLAEMPHTTITVFGDPFVLIQPSSTFFVYFLGLVMILLGIFFLITTRQQKSRKYWGIGLVLWGISAIVAGTSYQAFGYEIKCRGRDYCLFTSDYELVYMLITAFSINFLVAATGYTSTGSIMRKRVSQFAVIDSIAYTAYLLVGAVLPVKFLVSYEGFMAFIGINFLLMFVLNIRHYVAYKDRLNRMLIAIWIGFLLVNAGYFTYLFSGFGMSLYQQAGIWFNENDVLHILLILWAIMVYTLLRNSIEDTASDSNYQFRLLHDTRRAT